MDITLGDLIKIGGGAIAVYALKTWQLLAGSQLTNLSLQVTLARSVSARDGMHDLVTTITLKKGNRSSLILTSVTVSISSTGAETLVQQIQAIRIPGLDRFLNLTPGEETQHSTHCSVPAASVCEVVVTVSGELFLPPWIKRMRGEPKDSFWSASAVSTPPLEKEETMSSSTGR